MKIRKGFTLVELLIVIVIIGILASGMMLASGAATASATATMIISDLRNLQAAALMYYSEHLTANASNFGEDAQIGSLYRYMGDSRKIRDNDPHFLFSINSAGWWVGYMDGRLIDDLVKEKLAAKGSATGIYSDKTATAGYFTSSGSQAWLRAR
jgi:general secretion pathway protein G